jgi:hypothetical protein
MDVNSALRYVMTLMVKPQLAVAATSYTGKYLIIGVSLHYG